MRPLPKPANDVVDYHKDDQVAECRYCGSTRYYVLLRGGYQYVRCDRCDHDITMTTIWGKIE